MAIVALVRSTDGVGKWRSVCGRLKGSSKVVETTFCILSWWGGCGKTRSLTEQMGTAFMHVDDETVPTGVAHS